MKRAVVIVGPSGAGKSTLVVHLLKTFPDLVFAVSATTRPPRVGEEYGVQYYFISPEEFQGKIEQGAFLEWKEFYGGKRYGTLQDEFDRIWANGKVPLTDVEVWGAESIKQQLQDVALVVFIAPPSFEVLEQRLRGRNADEEKELEKRLERVRLELEYQDGFDAKVINENLEEAKRELTDIVGRFLRGE